MVMKQDLRKLFEKERSVNHERRPDHEDQFIQKLYSELPEKKHNSFLALKIAASIAIFICIGLFTFYLNDNNDARILGNISPELKEIEDFYVSNINLEILIIQNSSKNKAVVSRYMNRLNYLRNEYDSISEELNEEGPNSYNIQATINNLKLQLELLQELRIQLISKTRRDEII